MTLYGVQGNLMSCSSKKIAENIMTPTKPSISPPITMGPLNVYLDLGGQKLNKNDFVQVCEAAGMHGEGRWKFLNDAQKNRWKSHRKLNHGLIFEIIKLMIKLWDEDPTYCRSIPIESPLGPDKVSTTLGDTFFDIDEAVKYATALRTGKIELADGTTRTAENWDFGRICRNYGILGTTGKNTLRFKTDVIGYGVRVSSGFIDRVFSSLLLELGRRGSLQRFWHDNSDVTSKVDIRISGYAAPVVLCSHGLDNFKTTGNINSLLFHAELMTGYTSVSFEQNKPVAAICPLSFVSGQFEPQLRYKGDTTRELFLSSGDLNTDKSFDYATYGRQLDLRSWVLDKLVANGVSSATATDGTFDIMPAVGGGGGGGGGSVSSSSSSPPTKRQKVGGRRYNVAGQRRNRRKRSTRKYNRSGKKKKTRVKRRKNRTRSKRRKNRTRTKRIRKLISKRKYNL